MYSEDDLLMISALQHLLFCPRQCALIHLEQQWTENRLTAEGRILHERVHTAGKESRRRLKTEFDVPIRSLQLGLIGRTDVVEFHLQDDGNWVPFPVEYKRGRPKKDDSDRVQLCAQAMCLEEMLDRDVPVGALFYGQKKRRVEVVFDQALRQTTIETAARLHALFAAKITPPPQYSRACESCSFLETCLPHTAGTRDKVSKYMNKVVSS
ncbi:CRISPR-associated protein Cas4 [Desulfogranum mediterraneum]|uniref:CRISPR-associated protein Cas4 n=1 Tax=Desulfogranum mediterraneum TaxID=160661 RepID=UPI00041D91B2|nr:CRISPR-associated protein Cas4 [Desulfogranum mediterraneum]